MYKRIILASGSPRRKELLTAAGVRFQVISPDVDEAIVKGEKPIQMVKRLAREKALEIWRGQLKAGARELILAADTTVVDPKGNILGKPENRKDALKMLSLIEGRTHDVLTAYALLRVVRGELETEVLRTVKTKVTMRPLTQSERIRYFELGESMDKAGAYAAQGAGMVLIEKIKGSYTNVVGLPMSEVIQDLKSLGYQWK